MVCLTCGGRGGRGVIISEASTNREAVAVLAAEAPFAVVEIVEPRVGGEGSVLRSRPIAAGCNLTRTGLLGYGQHIIQLRIRRQEPIC